MNWPTKFLPHAPGWAAARRRARGGLALPASPQGGLPYLLCLATAMGGLLWLVDGFGALKPNLLHDRGATVESGPPSRLIGSR